MVEQGRQPVYRQPHQPCSLGNNYNRCQSPGLGGPLPRIECSGNLASSSPMFFQPAGAQGSQGGTEDIPSRHPGQESQTSDGQHNGSLLCNEIGRYKEFMPSPSRIGDLRSGRAVPTKSDGPQNSLADQLSCKFSNHIKWMLNPKHLKEIFS